MLRDLTKNTKVQKFISFLIVIAILVPAILFTQPPQKVEAQWPTIDIKRLAKDIWANIKMTIARKIINAITQRTVQYINSGFHGNPFYLTNEKAFFKDIVKSEIKTLVDIYAYEKNKFPFGRQFALDTISSYQKQATSNAEYTLSKVINDPIFLKDYRDDFNVGGWDGFLINTQNPQNNYIGFQMIASEDIARKVEGTAPTNIDKVKDTLQKSQGFLAPQTCATNPKYNNGKNEFLQPGWNGSKEEKDFNARFPYDCDKYIDSGLYEACDKQWQTMRDIAKERWAKDNTCPGGLTTTTPGSIVGAQIQRSLESKNVQAEYAAALGNSLASIFDALLNKLFDTAGNKIGGLLGSSSVKEDLVGVDSPPNNTGYSGGGAEVCTDIQIAGGGNGGGGGGGGEERIDIDLNVDISGGGSSCTVINPPVGSYPTYPGTVGSTTTPPPGGPCVGGNTKCTCAEGVATYDVYAGAVSTAESIAYPNGLPAGTDPRTAQTAVCAAYTGPGICRPATQEDELIIEGLPAPYVTLSIDFLAGNPYYLWAHAVAACEQGQQ